MADCNAIQARLTKAQAAYDELMIGGAVTRFTDQNGETVQYSRADPRGLLAYIARLEDQLAACQAGLTRSYRGPLRFTYGRRGF